MFYFKCFCRGIGSVCLLLSAPRPIRLNLIGFQFFSEFLEARSPFRKLSDLLKEL